MFVKFYFTKNYKILNTKLPIFENKITNDNIASWKCLSHINRPWYKCKS